MPETSSAAEGRKIERLAPLCIDTVLTQNGRRRAAIVAPSGDAALRGAAEFLQDAIRERTGTRLPIREPLDVLETWPAKEHLIAVGVLGTNPLIEKLYFEAFTVVDHGFPGTGGYAIQTIHNPYGGGRNIVVLGGTDLKGLRAGAARLSRKISVEDGRSSLGHLVLVKPGADASGARKKREARAGYVDEARKLATRLGRDFNNARMLLNHMSQTSLRYLMSGDEGHLHAFKHYFSAHKGLGVPGMGTHMEMWRTLGYWDLVEESPVFTDDERLEVINHFLWLLYSNEGEQYGFFRHGLTHPSVRHNHQTLPALCLLFGGRYFGRQYDWPDASRWLKEAHTLFSTQFTSFKPMEDSAGYHWYTIDTVITYALVSGDMTFVENGALRRTCDLALMCTANRGAIPNYGDGGGGDVVPVPALSAAAYLYKDGRYQKAIGDRSRPLGRGFVTDGIEDRGLGEYDGVHSFPMDPQFYWLARDTGASYGGDNKWMEAGVPLAKAFDKVAFRGGTSKDGEFLLLDGLSMGSHAHDDGNSILELSAFGKQWLVEKTYTEGTNLQDHNAVSVACDGETTRPPGACSLEGLANLSRIGFSATQMSGLAKSDWRRHVVWLRGKWFVVLDALTAQADGSYRHRCFYRTLGEPALEGDRFSVLQDDREHRDLGQPGPEAARFQILSADGGEPELTRDSGEFGRYWKNYPWAEPTVNILCRTIRSRRRAGQADWFVNLLYADPASASRDLGIRCIGESWALLSEGDDRGVIGLSLEPGKTQGIGRVRSDARMLYLDGERVAMVDGRAVQAGGLEITTSRQASLEWSYAGEVTVESEHPVRITLESDGQSHTLRAPAGRSEHAVARVDGRSALKVLAGLDRLRTFCPKTRDSRDAALSRAPKLKVREALQTERDVTDVHALSAGGKVLVAAGTEDGCVMGLDGKGKKIWQQRTRGRIHSVAAADIAGDGQIEVVAGSDDAHTYLIDEKGKVRWAYEAPPYFGYWGHYASHCESRKVLAADIDGDGSCEILAATGNLKLTVLSAAGKVMWRHEHYGTPTMLAVADVDGDGSPEIMAGTGDFGCASNCYVLRGDGETIQNIANDGWASKLTALAAGPLRTGGPPAILCGTSKYHTNAWVFEKGTPKQLWQVGFGDIISALAVLPPQEGCKGASVVAGSASDYLCGISADGQVIWSRHLASMPTALALVPDGDDILVGTAGGSLYRVDGRLGRVRAWAQLAGPVSAVAAVRHRGSAKGYVGAGRTLAVVGL